MDSVKSFIYRFLSGPLILLGAFFIFYEWWFKGAYWVLFGFIPVTPLLILVALGMGGYFIKLGYIDGDVEKIKEILHDKS